LGAESFEAATTAAETMVQGIFASALGIDADKISVTQDFFTMGGTSLSAVTVLQNLRKQLDRPDLAIGMLLKTRTARALAEHVSDDSNRIEDVVEEEDKLPPNRATCCSSLIQSFLIVLLWLFDTGPYAIQMALYVLSLTKDNVFTIAVIIQVVTWVWGGIAAILYLIFKWSLLGRVRPGMHPLYGSFYMRWWFCQSLYRRAMIICPLNIFNQSAQESCPFIQTPGPLLNMWLRACGATIGADVVIDQALMADHDLVIIGARCSLNYSTFLNTSFVRDTWLILGPVTIAEEVTMGQRCNVMAWSSIGKKVELYPMTAVGLGTRIGPNSVWQGSPAQCIADNDEEEEFGTHYDYLDQPPNWNWHNVILPMLTSLFLAVVDYLVQSLTSYLTSEVKAATDVAVMILTLPPITILTGLVAMLGVSALCSSFTWVVKEGSHKVHSWDYTLFLIYQLALQNMNEHGSLYEGTAIMHNILQCIGAKIGKYTEFQGNAFQGMPKLMRMGEGSFIGGGSFTFTYQMKGDSVYLAPVIFDNAFLGNDSITAPGCTLEHQAFIGSMTPVYTDVVVPADEVWQGNPPRNLGARPSNNVSDGTDSIVPDSHFHFFRRYIMESTSWFGAIINNYLEDILLSGCLHFIIGKSEGDLKLEKIMLALPIIRGLAIILSFFMDWAAKWIMFGVIKQGEHGLWSCWLLSYNLYQNIFMGNSIQYVPDLLGTPFVASWFRSMGAKIGKNFWLYSTEFTEFDLVTIGDDVALNAGVTIQPHTYEDRVFKMGFLSIEDGVTIHASTLLLPGTVMSAGAEVLPLSLPFANEEVPRGTWQGNPVDKIRRYIPPLASQSIELPPLSSPNRRWSSCVPQKRDQEEVRPLISSGQDKRRLCGPGYSGYGTTEVSVSLEPVKK
jgi:non-ribosomal peptide synthetase-like protein